MTTRDFSSVAARLQKALDETGGEAPATNPKAHIASVQAQIEAIARGDLEAALANAVDEVKLDIFAPPEFPWVRRASGVAELRAALEQNFGSVADQRPEITHVFAEGSTVVLFGRERGRIRATGQTYDVEFVEHFTFSDGRLAAVRIVAAHVV